MNARQTRSSPGLDEVFGALSDPTRRGILSRLALGELSTLALAEPFEMSLPAVSKHLTVLERAVEATPELEQAVAQALAEQPLFRVMGAAGEAVDKLAMHYPEVAHKATQLVLGNQEALLSAIQQQLPRL